MVRIVNVLKDSPVFYPSVSRFYKLLLSRLRLVTAFLLFLGPLSMPAAEIYLKDRQAILPEVNVSRQLILTGSKNDVTAPDRLISDGAIVLMPRITTNPKEIAVLLNAYRSGLKASNRKFFAVNGLLDLLWDRHYSFSAAAAHAFLELAAGDVDMDPVVIERGLYGFCCSHMEKQICFIYMFDRSFLSDKAKMERYEKTVEIYEKVAAKLNIPSLNFGALLLKKMAEGELTQEQLYANGKLSQNAFRLLISEFQKMGRSAVKNNRIGIMDSTWNMQLMFYDGIVKLDRSGWLDWQYCPIDVWPHVLACSTPNKIAEVSFTGDTVGVEILYTKDSRCFEYQIDDLPWLICRVPQPCDKKEIPVKLLLANGLDIRKTHSLKIRLPESAEKNEIRIGNFFVRGRFHVIAKYMTEKDPLKRADLIYSEMPKIEFSVKKINFAPKTYQKLLRHEPVTIVMLGDSIIHDIYMSDFLCLLERYYDTSIRKIESVSGGGNCERYKEDKILHDMVIKYKPDLLFIGGISDYKPKETEIVIRKVQKLLPNTEIAILSPIYGSHNPAEKPELLQPADLQKESYHTAKMKMAAENNVPYIDISQPLYQYVMNNIHDVPFQVYKRDAVHASVRGRQAAGRVLYHIFISCYPKK